MKTVKIYYEDSYCRTFSAVVTECREGKNGFQVALDRTAFYPEGGGQPGDTGTLGPVRVTDTHEKDGVVWHFTDGPLEPGTAVEGTVDWDRRFDLMQQHSGEHIVSGIVHTRFGYSNVGFHMGSDVVTIDFDGLLTPEEIRSVEEEANRQVWLDRETQIWYPDGEALARLEYRSKKALTGDVRIVAFPGADVCACCGTHVRRTGEIGLIKLLSVQKFRSGVRVELLCGRRALRLLSDRKEQNDAISVLLSAKPEETARAVERLLAENERLKGTVYAMQEGHVARKAKELTGAGDVLLVEDGLDSDGVRRLCAAVLETCGGRCAVFSGSDGEGYKYALGEKDGDLRAFTKSLNESLHGRGGGKPFFTQGSVQASRDEIAAFFSPGGTGTIAE